MTTTPSKGRNISLSPLHKAVPGACPSPGQPCFIFHVAHFELCLLLSISYSFAQSQPFLRNILLISEIRAPIRGEEPAVCCCVTPDLSYDYYRRDRKKMGEDNKWDKKRSSTCTSYHIVRFNVISNELQNLKHGRSAILIHP